MDLDSLTWQKNFKGDHRTEISKEKKYEVVLSWNQ